MGVGPKINENANFKGNLRVKLIFVQDLAKLDSEFHRMDTFGERKGEEKWNSTGISVKFV